MKLQNFQRSDEQRAIWCSHLEQLFASLDIPHGTYADHVLESLAVYCTTYHPRGVQSDDLNLLIARAFCSVGHIETARIVLESMSPHHRHVERWLEILTELHAFPDLLPWLSAGVIRPADWASAQVDRMWTLDFALMRPQDSEKLEILIYRSLHLIMDQMLPLWDAVGGCGILGLRHLDALDFNRFKSTEAKSLTSEKALLSYIDALFMQAQHDRAWQKRPSVMKLDG